MIRIKKKKQSGKTAAYLLFFFINILCSTAKAQLNVLPIDNMGKSPSTYEDLVFLSKELKNAQVLLLGEPTHGEGNVFEIKTKIAKYLIEKEGFNAIAFESGIYDMYFAETFYKHRDSNYYESLTKSIPPIWSESKQFSNLIDYLNKNRSIKVLGFDPQFSSLEQRDFFNFFNKALKGHQISDKTTDYLIYFSSIVSYMQDNMSLPINYNHNKFNSILSNAIHSVNSNTKNQATKQILKQMLLNIKELAQWYYTINPNEVNEIEWKAYFNNIRDKQMAKNLLFHLQQDSSLKIICWGASAHFANDFSSFNNDEIKAFTPMGKIVKDSLKEKAYSIAFVSSSGTYGAHWEEEKPIPLDSSSYEHTLAKLHKGNFFFKTNELPKEIYLSALGRDILKGSWGNVFDGIIYMQKYTPTTSIDGSIYKAKRNADKATKQIMVQGCILNKTSKEPIAFANVFHPTLNIGTIADSKGVFKLKIESSVDSLFVSCVGYWGRFFTLRELSDTIYLEKSSKSLPEVTIKANKQIPAKEILKKLIEKINSNYDTSTFALNIGSQMNITNFDSILLRCTMESQSFYPQGYSLRKKNLTNQIKKVDYKTDKSNLYKIARKFGVPFFYPDHSSMFLREYVDIIKVHPMFRKAPNLNKYNFSYTIGTDSTYVIDFEAKVERFSVSDAFYIAEYEGRLHINRKNLALIKFESVKKYNIKKLNRFANKYQNKKDTFFPILLDKKETTQIVFYKKNKNNKYIISNSSLHHKEEGVLVKNREEKIQLDSYFMSNFEYNNQQSNAGNN